MYEVGHPVREQMDKKLMRKITEMETSLELEQMDIPPAEQSTTRSSGEKTRAETSGDAASPGTCALTGGDGDREAPLVNHGQSCQCII